MFYLFRPSGLVAVKFSYVDSIGEFPEIMLEIDPRMSSASSKDT
jgi:hypothetical protein